MPPTGGETGRRNAILTRRLGNWAEADGTGVAFDSSTIFVLPNGAKRSPDVAWIRRSRWAGLTDQAREGFPPLCPDFIIELRSAMDRLTFLQDKMEEYREQGAELGWLIDPLEQTVYVYRPNVPGEGLDYPGCISGEPTLPGFVLTHADIWSSE